MKSYSKNNSMFLKKKTEIKKTHLTFLEFSHIHSEFSSQEFIFGPHSDSMSWMMTML